MHYQLEVIMPPTPEDDLKKRLEEILKPFDEDNEDEERASSFYDWWEIGGRWSGNKLSAKLDQEKVKEFFTKLQEMKVTVSGIVFGKEELSPPEQAGPVDALWNEMFPDSGFANCPFFKHANSRGDSLPGDIMLYKDISWSMECPRVIFAAADYNKEKYEAKYMISEDFWNGVNHVESKWDRTLGHAIHMFKDSLKGYKEEYAESITPKDDWLVITIDYHS